MCYIELTKLCPSDNALITPADWDQHRPGRVNPGHSLPNGYRLTGFLLEYPKIGRPLKVLRVSRNGIKIPGIYLSTGIIGINADQLHTRNSVYQLRYLEVASDKLLALAAVLTRYGWL